MDGNLAMNFDKIHTQPINFAIGLLLIAAALLAVVLSPAKLPETAHPDLSALLKPNFGGWSEVKSDLYEVSLDVGTEESQNKTYDQVVMKMYQNQQGQKVMIALAWKYTLSQEGKVHRPEVCYTAQGYNIVSLAATDFDLLSLHGAHVLGNNMQATNSTYSEAVSYWIRTGETYNTGPFQTRWHIFQNGILKKSTDGILVRVSSMYHPGEDLNALYALNKQFLHDLLADKEHENLKTILVY